MLTEGHKCFHRRESQAQVSGEWSYLQLGRTSEVQLTVESSMLSRPAWNETLLSRMRRESSGKFPRSTYTRTAQSRAWRGRTVDVLYKFQVVVEPRKPRTDGCAVPRCRVGCRGARDLQRVVDTSARASRPHIGHMTHLGSFFIFPYSRATSGLL